MSPVSGRDVLHDLSFIVLNMNYARSRSASTAPPPPSFLHLLRLSPYVSQHDRPRYATLASRFGMTRGGGKRALKREEDAAFWARKFHPKNVAYGLVIFDRSRARRDWKHAGGGEAYRYSFASSAISMTPSQSLTHSLARSARLTRNENGR